jgi:hypothetical protein
VLLLVAIFLELLSVVLLGGMLLVLVLALALALEEVSVLHLAALSA